MTSRTHLTLNTISDDHHVLCRDGAPIGELRVELAMATRIVALLNLAGWVEGGGDGWTRTASISADTVDAFVSLDNQVCVVTGPGDTLDEALADAEARS